ncbi:MAG TPA: hypothetical protein VHK86_07765 [Nitrososphaera sp.]|jgi:hypothetical protein|nr:hypothetical protein [Nitrososphaera sp.]HEX2615593.1 hypothetical protein [Nitrososphaera sp.]
MLAAVVKLVKNTHRHPANQALHFIGAPSYAIGLGMIVGYLAGMQVNLLAGIAMWISAIAMFVAGHKIEGNVMTMTPVLVFRLLSRKAARYLLAKGIHFLRA